MIELQSRDKRDAQLRPSTIREYVGRPRVNPDKKETRVSGCDLADSRGRDAEVGTAPTS